MKHKGISPEETNRRIIASVGRGFRKHGFAGIGVDTLAKSAGVTSGAFYAHLGSKKAAFETALINGLDEVLETIPQLQKEHGTKWLHAFIEFYLSPKHAADRECGCALASMTTELPRVGASACHIYREKMPVIIKLVASGIERENERESESIAWALLALLTGGLNLARGMRDDAAVLAQIKTQAYALIS